jgi:hypothetical protein
VYFCSHDFKWKGSDALKNPSPHIGQGIDRGGGIAKNLCGEKKIYGYQTIRVGGVVKNKVL